MKKILAIIVACLLTFGLRSQNQTTRFVTGKVVHTQVGSGSGTFNVSCNFTDEGGLYDGTNVQVGDKLFVSDGGVGYFLPIDSIISSGPSTVIIRVLNSGISLGAIPTGLGYITRGSPNYTFSPFVSGISNADQQISDENFIHDLDSLLKYKLIEKVSGSLPPAYTPTSEDSWVAQSNGTGLLYIYNGSTWQEIGVDSLNGIYSHTDTIADPDRLVYIDSILYFSIIDTNGYFFVSGEGFVTGNLSVTNDYTKIGFYDALSGTSSISVNNNGISLSPNTNGTDDIRIHGLTRFNGVLTPSIINTNTHNYNPTGFPSCNVLRLSSSSDISITGFTNGRAGRIIFVHNVGSNDISFPTQNGGSLAANRFASDSYTLNPGNVSIAMYDSLSSRWRMTGSGTGVVIDSFFVDNDTLYLITSADTFFVDLSLTVVGDDWGAQVVARDSSLSGDGTTLDVLGIKNYDTANNNEVPSKVAGGIEWVPIDTSSINELQTIDTFTNIGDTVYLSLLNDGVPALTIVLDSLSYIDTSGYNSDFYIASDTLYIEDGNSLLFVDITKYRQYLDTFEIASNVLRASLSNDSIPFLSVNLAPYLDNSDSQNLTIEGSGPTYDIAISGGTDITIQGSGITLSESPANTLVFTAVDASATNEIQRLDTFTIVGNMLRGSLLNDGVPFSSVDLSPYTQSIYTINDTIPDGRVALLDGDFTLDGTNAIMESAKSFKVDMGDEYFIVTNDGQINLGNGNHFASLIEGNGWYIESSDDFTIPVMGFESGDGGASIYAGGVDPEGVVTAGRGSLAFVDSTGVSKGQLYLKYNADDDTGWKQIYHTGNLPAFVTQNIGTDNLTTDDDSRILTLQDDLQIVGDDADASTYIEMGSLGGGRLLVNTTKSDIFYSDVSGTNSIKANNSGIDLSTTAAATRSIKLTTDTIIFAASNHPSIQNWFLTDHIDANFNSKTLRAYSSSISRPMYRNQLTGSAGFFTSYVVNNDSLRLFYAVNSFSYSATGANIGIQTTEVLDFAADSISVSTINTTIPNINALESIGGYNTTGFFKKIVGTNEGDIIKWDSVNTQWEIGPAPTGSGVNTNIANADLNMEAGGHELTLDTIGETFRITIGTGNMTTREMIRMHTEEDAFTRYLVLTSPEDSARIFRAGNGREYTLQTYGGTTLTMASDSIVKLVGDSLLVTEDIVPIKNTMRFLLGLTDQYYAKRVDANDKDDGTVMVSNATDWVPKTIASQEVNVQSTIRPSQLTSTTNNWNPTGYSTTRSQLIVLTGNNTFVFITGLEGATRDGVEKTLENSGDYCVGIAKQHTSSDADNRFNITKDIILYPGVSATFRYDSVNTVWKLKSTNNNNVSFGGKVDLSLDPNTGTTTTADNETYSFNTNGGTFNSNVSKSTTFPKTVFAVSTSTAATAFPYISTINSNGAFYLSSNNSYIRLYGRIQTSTLSTDAEAYDIRFGLEAGASVDSTISHGAVINYIHSENSGNFTLKTTNSGGTTTTTNTSETVSASTRYNLELIYYPYGEVTCFINGTRYTSTSTLPANLSFRPFAMIDKDNGTTASTMYIESFDCNFVWDSQ